MNSKLWSLLLFFSFLQICIGKRDLYSQNRLFSKARKTALFRNPNNRLQFNKSVEKIRSKHSTCAANVCFVLDGTEALSRRDFQLQKSFVMSAIAILGGYKHAQVTAAEHAGVIDPVLKLSPPNDMSIRNITLKKALKLFYQMLE